MVFYRFTLAGIRVDSENNDIMRFKAMAATFPEIPEIKCSMQGISESCVDSYRMIILRKLTELNKDYYISRFGFKDITLTLVYPAKNNKTCDIANTDDCGVWNIYSHVPVQYDKKLVVTTPVLVYSPKTDSYGVGVVSINNYVVTSK